MNITAEFPSDDCRVRDVVRWHKESKKDYLKELLSAHYREQALSDEELKAMTDEMMVLVEGAMAAAHSSCSAAPIDAALRIAVIRFELGED